MANYPNFDKKQPSEMRARFEHPPVVVHSGSEPTSHRISGVGKHPSKLPGAGILQPGDMGTAEYFSNRRRRRRNILGEDTPVAEPTALMGSKLKDNAIDFMQDRKPIRALPPVPFHQKPFIKHFTKMWRNGPREMPRREQKTE